MNRHVYDTLNLTVAMHPSENVERMMARVMAYCLNYQEFLSFTKGLSEIDDPDIWVRTLDDQLTLWIDIGEPAFDRVKKSSHLAQEVKVYSFNSKSDVWWEQGKSKFNTLKAKFFQFDNREIIELAGLVSRTCEMSLTITDRSAFVATELGECEVHWVELV